MSGLYIHIPYCHSKCHYCDFYSTPVIGDTGSYVAAIKRELAMRYDEIEMPPATIYIGGGTPSILHVRLLEDLIKALPTETVEEFTIEVNPEDITPEFAKFIADTPINRVSIGLQTMNDHLLKSIGRRHSSDEAVLAVQRLRNAGISNISLDLIFGLPDQNTADWSATIDKTLALQPQHLSAYCLMYEPGTRLSAKLNVGKIKETPPEKIEEMYNHLCRTTMAAGFIHYEISNFALPGYHSRHNSSYWDLTPYLGLGAAAHSFDGNVRRHNPANIRKYVSATAPIFATETLTTNQRIDEYLLIRLRTADGIDLNDYIARFGNIEYNRLLNSAQRHIKNDMMTLAHGRLSINPSYWLITDSILVDLFHD